MDNLGVEGHWLPVHDGDPRVVALYRRHYSSEGRRNHNHFAGIAGPSERMVLLTVDARALWVWRLMLPPEQRVSALVNHDRRRESKGLPVGVNTSSYFGTEYGVMCSIFRNEGPMLSSTLILEAEELAWQRWPEQRLFTYVWDAKVRSVNPGYCFKVAGWRACGRNKDGRLSILEKLPKEENHETLAEAPQ